MRYKYYINTKEKTVIAVSTYGKRPVRGVAVCADEDVFDIERGKALAKAKCDYKIAKKRTKRSYGELSRANAEMSKARIRLQEMKEYNKDAQDAELKCKIILEELLKEY